VNGKSDIKMASSIIPTIIHILLQFNDIIFIQEHWLFHTQLHLLGEINEHITYVGKGVDKNDLMHASRIRRSCHLIEKRY